MTRAYLDRLAGPEAAGVQLAGFDALNEDDWFGLVRDLAGGDPSLYDALHVTRGESLDEWLAAHVRRLGVGTRALAGAGVDRLLLAARTSRSQSELVAALEIAAAVKATRRVDLYHDLILSDRFVGDVAETAARILAQLDPPGPLQFWTQERVLDRAELVPWAAHAFALHDPERLFSLLIAATPPGDPSSLEFPFTLAYRKLLAAGRGEDLRRMIAGLPDGVRTVAHEVAGFREFAGARLTEAVADLAALVRSPRKVADQVLLICRPRLLNRFNTVSTGAVWRGRRERFMAELTSNFERRVEELAAEVRQGHPGAELRVFGALDECFDQTREELRKKIELEAGETGSIESSEG